jgi:hypothetical protein
MICHPSKQQKNYQIRASEIIRTTNPFEFCPDNNACHGIFFVNVTGNCHVFGAVELE